jgi:hypothetical protein
MSTTSTTAQLKLENLNSVIAFKFDSVLYVQQEQYYKDYNKKLLYFILDIVETNTNITVNQVCSLLRNTLNVPEDITRGTLNVLITHPDCNLLKQYKQNDVIHLVSVKEESKKIKLELTELFSDLVQYKAPVYSKKAKSQILTEVSERRESAD